MNRNLTTSSDSRSTQFVRNRDDCHFDIRTTCQTLYVKKYLRELLLAKRSWKPEVGRRKGTTLVLQSNGKLEFGNE